MASAVKRSLSRRFSSRSAHDSHSSSVSDSKPASKLALKGAIRSLASESISSPAAEAGKLTTIENNMMRAGLFTDNESPKLHSISRATISAPVPPGSSLDLNESSSSPAAHGQDTFVKPGLRARQTSNLLLDSHRAMRSETQTPNAKNITTPRASVTIVDCSASAASTVSPSVAANTSPTYSRPAAAPPTMLKGTVPLLFNPALPAYVLDRIHPCLPLPAAWNREHDQYIVSLDVQDYHLPAIVRRLKQRFPELKGECVTPGMVDRRLRILDLRVGWQGWKRAISNMPPTGHVDDFDSGFDDHLSAASSSASPPKPNNAKKVLANVANKAKPNYRRISTGGMSGKITINKRGTSVTNLSVGDPNTLTPAHSPAIHERPLHHHSRSISTGGTHDHLMLNRFDSSPASSATAWTTGAAPSSPPLNPLTVPERAAAQLLLPQVRDFALHQPLLSGGIGPVKEVTVEKRARWPGDSGSPRGASTAMRGKGLGTGRGKVEFGKVADEKESRAMGVPSVMRTSSGRPVLR